MTTLQVPSLEEFKVMAGPDPSFIQDFAIFTYPMIKKLRLYENWDQKYGTLFLSETPNEKSICIGCHFGKQYNYTLNDKGVCIGCHLARLYNCTPIIYTDSDEKEFKVLQFKQGIDAACDNLECDQRELESVLHSCGAPKFPFGMQQWDEDIISVWLKLVKLEDW